MRPFVAPKKDCVITPYACDPDLIYSMLELATDPSVKTAICINTIRARTNWVMINGKWVRRDQCETYKGMKP